MTSWPIRSLLLDGLSPHELKAVVHASVERRYTAKRVIQNQADLAERMFLLTHGRARLFLITQNGQRILLRWLVPGDVAGGRALLPTLERYHLSTEVLKDSRFLVWDRRTLDDLAVRYPRLRQNGLLIADEFFGWLFTSHIALSCFTARQRCAAVLKSLAMAIGQKVTNGIEVEVTNEELANAAAISVFDASRLMSNWRRSGVIMKTRGKVLVRSLDLLTRQIQK